MIVSPAAVGAAASGSLPECLASICGPAVVFIQRSTLTSFGQHLGLGGRIGDQNREVSIVSVKIRNRALVRFHKTVLAAEEVALFFFFHLNDGAIKFGQEI